MNDLVTGTLLILISLISLSSVGSIIYLLFHMRIDQQKSMTLLASMIDQEAASTAIGLQATQDRWGGLATSRGRENAYYRGGALRCCDLARADSAWRSQF